MLKSLIFIVVLGADKIPKIGYAAITKETNCQIHREREMLSKSLVPMRLIPKCDSNGDYKPLQCFKGTTLCSCWDKEGSPFTQPSSKLKTCDCHLQQNAALKKRLMGNFLPQCEEDGSFSKRQCSGSTCS